MLLLQSTALKVDILTYVITKMSLIFIGVVYWNKISLAYRLVIFHGFISLLVEVLGYVFISFKMQNVWMYNIYVLLDYSIMGYVALLLLDKSRFDSPFYYVWILVPLLFFWDLYEHSIYSLCVNFMTIFYLLIAVVFFYIMAVNSVFKSTAILKSPIFWLSISIILYHGCTLPIWIIYKYAVEVKPSIASVIIFINKIVNILRYPIAAYAVYLAAIQYVKKEHVASKHI